MRLFIGKAFPNLIELLQFVCEIFFSVIHLENELKFILKDYFIEYKSFFLLEIYIILTLFKNKVMKRMPF